MPIYLFIIILAVGLRVDLSTYKTFTEMMLALHDSLHHCRCNGHFPFTTVADEVSLTQTYMYIHHTFKYMLTCNAY